MTHAAVSASLNGRLAKEGAGAHLLQTSVDGPYSLAHKHKNSSLMIGVKVASF